MGNPKEADRPWEVIGDHIHLDKRIYPDLQTPVIEAVERIRKQIEGLDHVEVVPWEWGYDSNVNSVVIRGETPKGVIVHEIFGIKQQHRLVHELFVPKTPPENWATVNPPNK